MGDGRYYTFYQFWGVIFLVIFSIFIVSNTVIGYYRNRGNKNDNQLTGLFIGLSLLSMIKIVEFVIPNLSFGALLRGLFALLLLLLVFEWFYYLNTSAAELKMFYNRYFMWSGILIVALMLIITKGNLLFKEYLFFETTFRIFYFVICLLLGLMPLVFIVQLLRSENQIHTIYRNKISAFMLLIFNFFPFIIYAGAVYFDFAYIDFVEIFIIAMLAISFNIVMYSQAPLGITVLTFEKVGDIIQDYIMVTDLEGKVIYQNKAMQQSDFFVSKDRINIDCIEALYQVDSIEQENSRGDKYSCLRYEEQEYYLGHQIDPLKDHKQVIGYIITIVDITELMELLNLLQEMKKEAKEVNKQLINYAEVVYDVEKEKQINILLEKVLKSRENDVKRLIEEINQLIIHVDQNDIKYMNEQINAVIGFNQDIIDEVRSTVNSYR